MISGFEHIVFFEYRIERSIKNVSNNVFYCLITLNRLKISETKCQICILLPSVGVIRFLQLRVYVPYPQTLSLDPPTKHVVRQNKRADICDNTKVYVYVYIFKTVLRTCD